MSQLIWKGFCKTDSDSNGDLVLDIGDSGVEITGDSCGGYKIAVLTEVHEPVDDDSESDNLDPLAEKAKAIWDMLEEAEKAGEYATITLESGSVRTGIPKLTKYFVVVDHCWYPLSDITGVMVVTTGKTTAIGHNCHHGTCYRKATVTPKPPDMSRQAEMIHEAIADEKPGAFIRGLACGTTGYKDVQSGEFNYLYIAEIKDHLETLWLKAHSEANAGTEDKLFNDDPRTRVKLGG